MKLNHSKRIIISIIIGVFIYSSALLYADSSKKIIAEENSLFGKIAVYDKDGKRFLSLDDKIHSAIILQDRDNWVYAYAHLAALVSMVWGGIEENRPANVLVIGLGGGVYPQSMIEQYPKWKIDTVEIDPVVARFAREYFYLDKKIQIHIGDGRKFLLASQKKYDIIFMDAFGENYIPPELYTKEFYSILKEHIVSNGIIIINSWENHPYREFEFKTISDSFPNARYIIHPYDKPSNRIYFYGSLVPLEKDLIVNLISKNWQKTKFKNAPLSENLLKTISKIPVNTGFEVLTDENIFRVLKIKK